MFRYQIDHEYPAESRKPVRTFTAYRDDPHDAYRDLLTAAGSCQLRTFHAGSSYPYSVDVSRNGVPVAVAWLEDEEAEEA